MIKPRLFVSNTPGSQTFEMQDTKALVAAAHNRNCLAVCDNTWGTPFYFDAVGHGIDIVIEAGTKYIGGHSDVSIGFVAASGDVAKRIRRYTEAMGLTVGPDDQYLALRGMRTIAVRLKLSENNGLHLARAGWNSSRKCWPCATPGLKATPSMISGNGISPAHRGCSA